MSNREIFISVIIPVYNAEEYLDECLQSILKQTIIENIELICVNDGSSDSSLDILNMYKTKFPNMIIIDQKNAGSAIARNNGLQIANGEYVYFVDNDDYLANDNCLNELYSIAKKTSLDILNFNHLILKNNSLRKVSINRENNKIYTGKEYLSTAEKGNITNTPWDKLLKGSYLKEINFAYTSGVISDDAESLLRLFYNAKKVSFIDNYAYVYRIRPNSVMTGEKTEKYIISTKKILETYTAYYKSEKDKGIKRFLKSLIFNRLLSYYELLLEKKEFLNKYKDDYEIYKTNYLNNLEKLFIENEEKYLNKYKNSKSKLAKKLNLNYFIRRFRKIYLKN
ncbi:glycosyltransferase [Aliarcobacter cryaerophilus]|uniref:glycosyltransferase n=1 Tax=Aliarcobacter cryaerophilus TaxID=28198 RepID=UPI0021B63251|nr:glycosyltransferase [Aliarcobacter cryaerophilus]MCT7516098.1 glycosyltransferase [Aliarcobacter cryaerophilus]